MAETARLGAGPQHGSDEARKPWLKLECRGGHGTAAKPRNETKAGSDPAFVRRSIWRPRITDRSDSPAGAVRYPGVRTRSVRFPPLPQGCLSSTSATIPIRRDALLALRTPATPS